MLTWEQVYTIFENPCGPNESGPPVLNFAADQDGYLYFNDPGRLFRSADQGGSWQHPAFQLFHIEDIVPMQGDTLLIGLYGATGGVYRTTAHGDAWEATDLMENVFDIAASTDRSIIYAITAADRLVLSLDRGMTWSDVNSAWEVTAVTVGPYNRTYVQTATGIYTSDDGDSWQAESYNRFPYPTPLPGYLLSRDGNRIFLSTDNGSNWNLVLDISSPSLLTNQEDTIIAVSGNGSVFESPDFGETWLQIGGDFPDTCSAKSAVTVDPWGHLVAGTSVGVVFRTIESTHTDIEDSVVPERFSLEANYPNPFNPSTTITYTLPHPANIRLEIFDLLGRHHRLVDKGPQPAGAHTILLDASGLPSGVYFYTLTAEDFTRTRKMVVVK